MYYIQYITVQFHYYTIRVEQQNLSIPKKWKCLVSSVHRSAVAAGFIACHLSLYAFQNIPWALLVLHMDDYYTSVLGVLHFNNILQFWAVLEGFSEKLSVLLGMNTKHINTKLYKKKEKTAMKYNINIESCVE